MLVVDADAYLDARRPGWAEYETAGAVWSAGRQVHVALPTCADIVQALAAESPATRETATSLSRSDRAELLADVMGLHGAKREAVLARARTAAGVHGASRVTRPRGDRAERRRLLLDRICYVCLQPIAPRAGVVFAWLSIIVHHEPCGALVRATSRDYGRSRRGRWVASHEHLRRLRAMRPQQQQHDGTTPPPSGALR
jgi:hypothetical protein